MKEILENNLYESKDVTSYESTHSWEVEGIDLSDGVKLYVVGAEFPQKLVPNSEVLWSLNVLKKMIRELLALSSSPQFFVSYLLLLFSWKKFLRKIVFSFNSIADKILGPFKIKPQYMTPFGKELELFLVVLLMELGIPNDFVLKGGNIAYRFARNVSHIFEYDLAYMWRVQDLLSETSPEFLGTHKELKRLGMLAEQRDIPRMAIQTKKIMLMLRCMLLVPSFKKAFKTAISSVNFKNLQFDEADRYWACLKTDYNFFGKTPEERMQMIKDNGWKIPISTPVK